MYTDSDFLLNADGRGTLSLRLPAWRTFTQCEVDGKHVVLQEKDDYAYFEVEGSTHVKLVFGMRPRFVYANERGGGEVFTNATVNCAVFEDSITGFEAAFNLPNNCAAAIFRSNARCSIS